MLAGLRDNGSLCSGQTGGAAQHGGCSAAPTAGCQTPLQTQVLAMNVRCSLSWHPSGEQPGQPASTKELCLFYSGSQLPQVGTGCGTGTWACTRGAPCGNVPSCRGVMINSSPFASGQGKPLPRH